MTDFEKELDDIAASLDNAAGSLLFAAGSLSENYDTANDGAWIVLYTVADAIEAQKAKLDRLKVPIA